MSAPLVGDASEAWSTWVARFAPGESTSRPNLFDEPALMLDAAAQGAGVALTHMFLAEPYLASGELRMLPFLAPSGQQLVLRSRIGASKVEFGERFAMWLKLELARSAALLRRAIPTP
jgi:DNA-binding transcriptional LysR family regulator